jgi:hypothetical protein
MTGPALDITLGGAERIASIQRLADELAAEVGAFHESQTLSEHIRDRGEWSGLELDARRLRAAVAVMAERERERQPDLFEGTDSGLRVDAGGGSGRTPAREPVEAGGVA